MGAVTQGIPRDHVEVLKRIGSYSGFFETGTYLGATAEWAAGQFAQVHTVEASPELFQRAKAVLAQKANVVQHQGRSADVLRRIVPTLAGRWLFWLDAHWSAGDTFGQGEECPLLGELEIVLRGGPHALLIDDARLFFRPFGPPHDWRQWPTIDDICATIRDHATERTSVTVVDDVIFALPRAVHEPWCEHLHALASQPTGAPARRRGLAGWFARR
jgi:hypothetical protein